VDLKCCFITSVDTIYLLEGLIGVRFTVEEKNRIRRNLEGFKPITVSKTKPEFENFFKLIMSFPNPKPRNIEKDVKVFPWNSISNALQKIIGKYSAIFTSAGDELLKLADGSSASTVPTASPSPGSPIPDQSSPSMSPSGQAAHGPSTPVTYSINSLHLPAPEKVFQPTLSTVSSPIPPDRQYDYSSFLNSSSTFGAAAAVRDEATPATASTIHPHLFPLLPHSRSFSDSFSRYPQTAPSTPFTTAETFASCQCTRTVGPMPSAALAPVFVPNYQDLRPHAMSVPTTPLDGSYEFLGTISDSTRNSLDFHHSGLPTYGLLPNFSFPLDRRSSSADAPLSYRALESDELSGTVL